MSKLKEGDKVRIKSRPTTEQDRKVTKYFQHMAGLTGTVANYYNDREVAVQVDLSCLPKVPAAVHAEAARRMRDNFLKDDLSEEAKKKFTPEELEFVPNYVLLVAAEDLEKA